MNPSTLYATTFIDALVAAGLKRVCLLPGSRHTPLVLALSRHRAEIQLSSHLDERSAAFFALGMALGADEPAAVVCTSGSAAANVFPAVIEARQARIPLILLTADRPHELRHSGANQTIDQLKLFGEYCELFVDAPLPERDPPALALRNLRTLAARAYDTAKRQRGVVHINLPFRKPFEPTDDDDLTIDRRPPTQFLSARPARQTGMASLLTGDLLSRRGLIYCGHGSARSETERRAMLPWLRRLAQVSGFPVLAEFTSNLRGEGILGAYESWLPAVDLSRVETLIRFGAPPLCKGMQEFVGGGQLRQHIHGSRAGKWADDSHSLTQRLTIDPASLDASEFDDLPDAPTAWRSQLAEVEAKTWRIIAEEMGGGAYFDGAVAHDMAQLMPADGAVFAGSSLPIRQLDQFAAPRGQPPLAFANRGASGIDGNVSTALGIGMARAGQPLAALLGDITLYHDMNGLLAVRRCGVPVTIVLLNNDGGGIFQRLPVRGIEPAFREFFLTPHGLDFSHAAALYGLRYVRADDRDSFRAAFAESVRGGESAIIEVRTDSRADLQRREDIMRAISTPLGPPDASGGG